MPVSFKIAPNSAETTLKKPRNIRDEEIRGKIASTLTKALARKGLDREKAAELLDVELGTLSKYLTAKMIPGGHVLWRACKELGLVMDETGLRLARHRGRRENARGGTDDGQYELPFVDGSVAGDKVHLTIHRTTSSGGKKSVKRADYVSVNLRIKVAD